MNEAAVELVFMMVILKLPIVYLCGVIWWAVRAEPKPFEAAALPAEPACPRCPWHGCRRGRGPGLRPNTQSRRRPARALS